MAINNRKPETEHLADECEDIAEHCANLAILDDRRAEDILEYDESGLPR